VHLSIKVSTHIECINVLERSEGIVVGLIGWYIITNIISVRGHIKCGTENQWLLQWHPFKFKVFISAH